MKQSVKQRLVVLVIAATISAPVAKAQSNRFSPPLKANDVIGMKVEDIDGQRDGSVRNLVVDTRTGQLKYVMITSGGVLGVRSTSKLVPPQVVSAATTKRQTLAIALTTEQWERAPVFKPVNLALLSQPDRTREIALYYRRTDTRVASSTQPSLSATGSETGTQTNAPGTLKFSTDLIGRRALDRNQQKLGEIVDLLVSFEQPRSVFAIVSTGRFLHRGQQYAVSLASLRTTDNGKTWVIDRDSSSLQNAPQFDQQVWQSPTDTGKTAVYRYSKTNN